MRNLLIILLLIAFSSCGDISKKKKFKYAGGTFNFAINNAPSTLIPRYVTDLYSSTLLNQVYEGLVELDPKSLETRAGLAKDWTISADGKTISFELRDNVYFHKHPSIEGKNKFTAEDVVYSIELACKQNKTEASSAYYSIFRGLLEGADEFYNKEADHISGLKFRGNTLEMKLLERDVNFVNKLTQTAALIVSKKAIEAGLENELIGTGPFTYSGTRIKNNREEIVLARNENYYGKDDNGLALPYLDTLIMKVEGQRTEQLEMFERGEIHLIEGLPPEKVSKMLGEGQIEDFNGTPPKFILVRKPLLATQYYYFNLLKPEFKDVRVRKAFNYAIDRGAIISNILNYQAFKKGDGGIIPPMAFNGYKSENVGQHGYTFEPEKAKRLLAQAGYPNGKDFPIIHLKYNLGTIHSDVAIEIASQLKQTLNIDIKLEGVTFEEKLEDQKFAKGDLFRSSWFAEYNSPESFLMTAYGKTVPGDSSQPSMTNYSRYQNDNFDALFEQGKISPEIVERYRFFAEAETILMDDSPFIILWYEETIKIIYSKVRNLKLNKMNSYSFKNVYLKDWSKKEWETKEKQ
jgi:ABC-type transport system substrate-binding protein